MNQTPPPRPDDDELRSIMLERLSIAAARGGLEMEEKLKSRFVGLDIPSCSFVFPKGRDHHIYKQKIAEYTKSPPRHSPPPLPPGLVDQCCLKYNPLEQVAIIDELSAFTVRVPEGGMTRKELGIIKFTAQFVLRYGQYFRLALRDRVSTDTEFKFLDKGDSRAHFFSLLFLGYSHLLRAWEYPLVGMDVLVDGFLSALNSFKEKLEGDEELVDKIKTDRHDFVVCDEYFADLENKALELKLKTMARMHHPLNKHDSQGALGVPPVLVLFRVGIPQGGMMRKELGLMKFTAMFVVRYGNDFWDALWDRVSSTETEFQFLKRNPGNDRGMRLFSQLLLAFGNVVQPWGLCPRESNLPARMEAVLEGFFTAFSAFKKKQEEDEDEVVNKLVTDRRDFVVSETFQYFLDIEESTPLPERLPLRQTGSMFARRRPMVQQPPLLHEKPEPKGMVHPPPSLHEIPEAKRGKLDESVALVSEDEFLAQHPGSSTITISVTNVNDIQIKVQSLSVNVRSLKEKIAGEMGIPANRQKLTGKSGVLKDDMSLAHYNLGAGEKLTLTC